MSTAMLNASAQLSRDSDGLYEVVDGVEVELPPMSTESMIIASRLSRKLSYAAESGGLGECYNEPLIELALEDRKRDRRPDFVYVSYALWPRKSILPRSRAWNIKPEIACEVVSPADNAEELQEKTREYFEAGIGQVWVVYPLSRTVMVHNAEGSKNLSLHQTLSGGDMVPGFELPLMELFGME